MADGGRERIGISAGISRLVLSRNDNLGKMRKGGKTKQVCLKVISRKRILNNVHDDHSSFSIGNGFLSGFFLSFSPGSEKQICIYQKLTVKNVCPLCGFAQTFCINFGFLTKNIWVYWNALLKRGELFVCKKHRIYIGKFIKITFKIICFWFYL